MKLNKIDCSNRDNHKELEYSDECFYWCEYTAQKKYNFSETNQLIVNLKKCVSHKSESQYSYKTKAINTCASYFKGGNWSSYSIIPIPPSKKKTDPLYDDRLLRILDLANSLLETKYQFDVKDIIIQNENYEPSHKSSKRPSSQELKARYRLESISSVQLREKIIIFDDVLTMGSHFKAIKSLLQDAYPQKKIYGLFIARSIYPPVGDDIEDLLKKIIINNSPK